MSTYIPSVVINFKLKFDESLTLKDDAPTASNQKGLADPGGSGPATTATPLILRKGEDQISSVLARIPKSASLEMAGYRQAGKWSATFDFADLPIDPRTVSAAAIEFHIGTITPKDFTLGMLGREADGTLKSILQTVGTGGTPNTSTLRMLGVVDEWHVRHLADGSIVELTGRDMRGILLDTPVDVLPGAQEQLINSLDLSRPVNEVVIQILAFNAFFIGYQVVANENDWPDGVIPAPAGLDDIPRHRKGAKGKRKSGRGTPPSSSAGGGTNFWTLIVRFCYLVGAVPYVNNMGQIVIRPGASIYDKLAGPVDPVTNPTPFRGGLLRGLDHPTGNAITPALRARRLVYGRDVESIEFNRKFSGWAKPKIVRAFCLNPDTTKKGGTMVYGLWPPQEENPKKSRYAPGKGPSMEEVLNVRVSGITDAGLLTQIAKSVFNEIGRGEMGGSVSTPNLASFGGDSSDPDLLSLSPGDGIELLVDTRAVRSGSPLISTFTESQRLSFDDQVKAVFKVLGNMTLARVIVATQRGQVTELQRFFLVQNVKYAWSDKGIKIDFDYTNYVQARWGVDEEVEINDPLIVTGTLVGQTTTVIAEGHVISAVAPIPPKPKPRKGKVVVITVTEGHVVKANAIRIQQEHVITATVTR